MQLLPMLAYLFVEDNHYRQLPTVSPGGGPEGAEEVVTP